MIVTQTYIAQYCNKTHPKKKIKIKKNKKHNVTKNMSKAQKN